MKPIPGEIWLQINNEVWNKLRVSYWNKIYDITSKALRNNLYTVIDMEIESQIRRGIYFKIRDII